ncbi:DUF2249 domain-containing protein [Gemmobacter nectariphilus]|uniref:DUF2249 domain-containing protein n=1 Tax=Gemmobacter nectariphilus TaxID=220343 RepID=UPI000417800E|nr:DUF2249 domain-containing protein [Gemmobacter nectariphilus]
MTQDDDTRFLDVRPILAAGQEPFALIMQTVRALPEGAALRLIAPFRPVQLFSVLARRGFEADARPREDGSWEVLFTPVARAEDITRMAPGSAPEAMFWPDPVCTLDLHGMALPEAATRILATLKPMAPGDVLFALLGREPDGLFADLAAQGDEWAGNFAPDGRAYRLLIRRGDRA